MLRRVAVVKTEVSEELVDSIVSVTRIGELRTTLTVTSNLLVTANVVFNSPILVTLMMKFICSCETTLLPSLLQPHGVTSQKTVFFIVSSMKTLDLRE
jgi:hypothetical protein